MSDLLVESFRPLEASDDHLAEHRFLLLEVGELLLEVAVLLLLGDHAQLQSSIQ